MTIQELKQTIPLSNVLGESWPGEEIKILPCSDEAPFHVVMKLQDAPRALILGLQLKQAIDSNKNIRIQIAQSSLQLMSQSEPLIKRRMNVPDPIVVPKPRLTSQEAYQSPPMDDAHVLNNSVHVESDRVPIVYYTPNHIRTTSNFEHSSGSPHPRNSSLLRSAQEPYRSPSPPLESQSPDDEITCVLDSILEDLDDGQPSSPPVDHTNPGAPPPSARSDIELTCFSGFMDHLTATLFAKDVIPCPNWYHLRQCTLNVSVSWSFDSFELTRSDPDSSIITASTPTFNHKEDSDCILRVNGQDIYVASSILCTQSPYFSAMLNGTFSEAVHLTLSQSHAIVSLQEVSYTSVFHCIQYMYTGYFSSANLSIGDLMETYRTAEKIMLDTFLEPVQETIVSHVNEESFGDVYVFAAERGLSPLMNKCLSIWKERVTQSSSTGTVAANISHSIIQRRRDEDSGLEMESTDNLSLLEKQMLLIVDYVWCQGPHELASFMLSLASPSISS